jgi:hypothetical protein
MAIYFWCEHTDFSLVQTHNCSFYGLGYCYIYIYIERERETERERERDHFITQPYYFLRCCEQWLGWVGLHYLVLGWVGLAWDGFAWWVVFIGGGGGDGLGGVGVRQQSLQ